MPPTVPPILPCVGDPSRRLLTLLLTLRSPLFWKDGPQNPSVGCTLTRANVIGQEQLPPSWWHRPGDSGTCWGLEVGSPCCSLVPAKHLPGPGTEALLSGGRGPFCCLKWTEVRRGQVPLRTRLCPEFAHWLVSARGRRGCGSPVRMWFTAVSVTLSSAVNILKLFGPNFNLASTKCENDFPSFFVRL